MELVETAPMTVQGKSFGPAVEAVSPAFVKIYAEAEQALALGLKEIAGPGFRKALEFLIKDYAKKISDPSTHPDIEKKLLGPSSSDPARRHGGKGGTYSDCRNAGPTRQCSPGMRHPWLSTSACKLNQL